MATWDFAACDSMANALNLFATNTASLQFYDSVGSAVGPILTCSATFASAAVSGALVVKAIVSATATGAYTLGTARLFANGGATIGTFICTTGGTADFVFGALNVTTSDSIIVNSWTVSVSTTGV